jgi:hypothetical protein
VYVCVEVCGYLLVRKFVCIYVCVYVRVYAKVYVCVSIFLLCM